MLRITVPRIAQAPHHPFEVTLNVTPNDIGLGPPSAWPQTLTSLCGAVAMGEVAPSASPQARLRYFPTFEAQSPPGSLENGKAG